MPSMPKEPGGKPTKRLLSQPPNALVESAFESAKQGLDRGLIGGNGLRFQVLTEVETNTLLTNVACNT